jgi:hypothetical protein
LHVVKRKGFLQNNVNMLCTSDERNCAATQLSK